MLNNIESTYSVITAKENKNKRNCNDNYNLWLQESEWGDIYINEFHTHMFWKLKNSENSKNNKICYWINLIITPIKTIDSEY